MAVAYWVAVSSSNIFGLVDPPEEDTVKAHIKSLRQKIKAGGPNDLIETVHGVGYHLKLLS